MSARHKTKLSVCIPAFNRPIELVAALRSIAAQGSGDWDVVICEDRSPRGDEIEAAVRQFMDEHAWLTISFFRNERNLGYDGNLRRLFDVATGEYCMIMGDDDVLLPRALERVLAAVMQPGVGYVLRAWRSVEKESGRTIEEFRYFDGDRIFRPGLSSAVAMFRRSVFISGLTFRRDLARELHTNEFDGTLLYQLYLVGRLLQESSAYYISDPIAVRRVGGEHYFGSSDVEKDRFAPRQLSPAHSLAFVRGLIDIARTLDREYCPGFFDLVLRDLGRYSYPLIEIQASSLSRRELSRYTSQLADLGLGRSWLFWVYYAALVSVGPRVSAFLLRSIKRILGKTPNLGGSSGAIVS